MSEGLDIDELQTLRAFPIVIPAKAGIQTMPAFPGFPRSRE
jgi:hypothetical protein